MGIFLIIVLLIVIFWPWISRWLQRMALNRMDDYMRRATGRPTRKEERRRQRAGERSGFGGFGSSRKKEAEKESHRRAVCHPARLMQLVAVDIEFVEIKSYSSTIEVTQTSASYTVVLEEQISDAEYTEIKDNRK